MRCGSRAASRRREARRQGSAVIEGRESHAGGHTLRTPSSGKGVRRTTVKAPADLPQVMLAFKVPAIRDVAKDDDGFALDDLQAMQDDEARLALTRIRGIGRWTADVYLTMCLLRPDVWPHGDQALVTGAVELLGLSTRPTFDELEATAERWRPLRAVAARVIWHHYLRLRGRPV